MNAKNLLKALFAGDKFQPAHKRMTESLGVVSSLILQQHIYKQSLTKGKYTNIRKTISNDYRDVSIKIQRRVEKELIKLGFLTKESVSINSEVFFEVHPKSVIDFLLLDRETRIKIVDETLSTKPIKKKERVCPQGREGIPQGQTFINTIKNISSKEDNKNQNSCSQNLKPTVSRLLPKTDDLVETRKKSKTFDKKNSLINRTNIATGKSKPIPKQTKACIEYWNSFPELTTHKITEDNLSKTIKNASSLLGKLFNGTLLDVISIPKGFKDYKWFDRKVSAEEFFDIVDDFIYCIRSPEVRPISNGTKYNLVSFLKGSEYTNTQNGGMPSLMLNYCFGDYKTVIVDKNPQATLKIKELWNDYIGKFNDTPATEKAFILASNICVERFREKREEEEGWISAMNNYKPEGIIKQILINKKDWFRKEKKSPEIMGTGFFTNIIRRYDYDRHTGEKTI